MSVVLPEPVWPISAIVVPARDVEVDVAEHGPVLEILEGDVLEADRAVAGRQVASGAARRAISSGSSITSKIRSPAAVARCAWPIHMPSARSGITSMPR